MSLEPVDHLLTLLLGAVAVLLVGIALPRRAQTWNALPAGLVLLVALYLTQAKLDAPPGPVLAGAYAVDALALWSTLIVLLGALLVLLLSLRSFRGDAREAEFYALLLLASLGAVVLVGALDFMQILLGVLLLAVGCYPLLSYRRSEATALEASLKYYLLGGLLNIGLLYGLVLFYGLTGSTLTAELPRLLDPDNERLLALASVLVIAGLGSKAGYVPGHFWVPDAHQGATPPVAALVAVLPKLAALVALLRLVDALSAAGADWTALIALIAAVTMTWGNLAAAAQESLPRLLGYTAMAQTGYLLLAVAALPHPWAVPALLFQFLAYTLATLAIYGVLAAAGSRTRADLHGLWRSRPLLITVLALALLSLIGIPPLAGFTGKLALLLAAFQAGHGWLTAVALANTLLSLYVYGRLLSPAFAAGEPAPIRPSLAGAVALGCATALLLTGLLGLAFFLATPGFGGG